jgi:hypothetical protein
MVNNEPSFADLKQAFDDYYNNAISSEQNAIKAGYKSVRGAKWSRTYDINHTTKLATSASEYINNPRKYDYTDVDTGSKVRKAKTARKAARKPKTVKKTKRTSTSSGPSKKTLKLNKRNPVQRDIYLQLDVQQTDDGDKYIILYVPDGTKNNYITWDAFLYPDYDNDSITPEYLNEFFDEMVDVERPIENLQSVTITKPPSSLLVVNNDKSNIIDYLKYINDNYIE